MDFELEGVAIVLVGSFNPAIYHPAWFQKHDILASYDIADAKIDVVHSDIAQFKLDWLAVRATKTQFLARCDSPDQYGALVDFVVSSFSILAHTPIDKLGINREVHVACDSIEQWHHIGDVLAPKNIWEKYLDGPGMKSLTMMCNRKDDLPGIINFKIEPSVKLQTGVYVQVNNHFEFGASKENADQETDPNITPMKLLLDHGDSIIKGSDTAIEGIIMEASSC